MAKTGPFSLMPTTFVHPRTSLFSVLNNHQLTIDLRTMDFAPYQDTSPETVRALSPPPRRSSSRSPNPTSPSPNRLPTNPFLESALPPPSHFSNDGLSNGGGRGGDIEGERLMNVNLFETSLPLRMDYEAMLAYLLLPPAGGVFLLVVEHKSDYVRYVC